MCELCELCEQLTKIPMQNNCKYATPLYFYRVNCIFFGFRAFYRFFIQIFAVILHSHSALGSQWLIPLHLISGRPRPLLSPKIRDFRGPQERFIARSSHVHRITIAHTCTSSRYVPCGRSSSASGVPEVGAADNRTEIISPANKQYKDRKSLAAFQEPFGRY